MSDPPFFEQTRLRTAMTAVETEMRKAPTTELLASWAALVKILNLGPAPKFRDCPHCGQSIMHDAIRCRECWRKVPAAT